MKYHPDKNHGDARAAAERFIQIQAAYETLIDPQERAWYDSHRESILRDVDTTRQQQPPAKNDRAYQEIIGISIDDVLRYFDGSYCRDFGEGKGSFFKTYGDLFLKIINEETTIAEQNSSAIPRWPNFGTKSSTYDSTVRVFYAEWSSFTTEKTFSWKDRWRYSDAPDRRIKRAMEKENKSARDMARREYNDTVRSLILYIRKRDPRYTPPTKADLKQQRAAQVAAQKAQAAESKANFLKMVGKHVEQEWMKVESEDDAFDLFADELVDEEDVPEEIFECIACSKKFKSQGQYESHKQSRAHQRAVKELKREMQFEDQEFGLGDGANGYHELYGASANDGVKDKFEDLRLSGSDVEPEVVDKSTKAELQDEAGKDLDSAKEIGLSSTDNDSSSDSNLELSLEEQLDKKNRAKFAQTTVEPKIGKAKQKRMKRAAKIAEMEKMDPDLAKRNKKVAQRAAKWAAQGYRKKKNP